MRTAIIIQKKSFQKQNNYYWNDDIFSIIITMKDDSSISPKKKGLVRAKTMLTDSFSRMGASLLQQGSSSNKKVVNLTIAKLKIIEKDGFQKQDECQICFITFSKLNRQHHCRICGNAICSDCSFSTINKERACDICAYHYSDLDRQQFKKQVLQSLTDIGLQYLANKMVKEEEVKRLQNQLNDQSKKNQQKRLSETKMKALNEKFDQVSRQRKALQLKIEELKKG